MDILKLTIDSFVCCEYCMCVCANMFECPVCKRKTYTENTCSLEPEYYSGIEEYETEITCQDCKTKFRKVSENWYKDCEVVIVND